MNTHNSSFSILQQIKHWASIIQRNVCEYSLNSAPLHKACFCFSGCWTSLVLIIIIIDVLLSFINQPLLSGLESVVVSVSRVPSVVNTSLKALNAHCRSSLRISICVYRANIQSHESNWLNTSSVELLFHPSLSSSIHPSTHHSIHPSFI